VLLDNLLDLLLLEVLLQVVLHEELHGGSSAETGSLGILGDGESSTSSRLPDVLFVVVVLGGDLDLFGNEVGRVETDTELTWRLADSCKKQLAYQSWKYRHRKTKPP
jgi:hypothetical protein